MSRLVLSLERPATTPHCSSIPVQTCCLPSNEAAVCLKKTSRVAVLFLNDILQARCQAFVRVLALLGQPAAMADSTAALTPSGALTNGSSTKFTTADATSVSAGLPSQPSVDQAFPGQPTFSFGPVDIHTAGLVRQFRLRQKIDLTDKLSAAAGLYYDFKSTRVGPTAMLTYRLDEDKTSKCRIEINDSKVLVRKGWEVQVKKATIGVSAECSLNFRDADGKPIWGQPIRPDLHVSLDHVKPLQYELIGLAAVLLLNLPVKLNNKEVEAAMPGGLGRLKGFVRGSLKRTGYMRYKVGFGESSGILDL